MTFRTAIILFFTYGAVSAFLSPTDKGFVGDMGFNMGSLLSVPLVAVGIL